MSRGRKRRIPARLRAALVRLATMVVALVTLFGMLRAGASYVYCPMMDRISDAPCCAADRDEHTASESPELRSADCCERHVLAKLPATSSAARPTLSFSAPFVALVPALVDLHAAALPPMRERFEHEGRAGPIASSRHRAELMVFLN